MIFLKTVRQIERLRLKNMIPPTPFTTEAKHLDHFFSNNPSLIKHDMKVKRAMKIQKNCDLIQEFGFCHPKTCSVMKLRNTSVRIMMGIPRNTHRYLIQPLTEMKHLKQSSVLRLFNFKLSKCKKEVARTVFSKLMLDVRSTTGSNSKEISLVVDKRV